MHMHPPGLRDGLPIGGAYPGFVLRGLRPSDPLLARIQSMLAALASIF
jgi:hypothetical protein